MGRGGGGAEQRARASGLQYDAQRRATAPSTARRSTSTSPTRIGRKWQLRTIQLDYLRPERFDLTYIGEDNAEHRPVVHPPRDLRLVRALHRHPHRALRGRVPGLARAGAGARRDRVGQAPRLRARGRASGCAARGLRVELDEPNDKLGAKIRDAAAGRRSPITLVSAKGDGRAGGVAPRRHGGEDLKLMSSSSLGMRPPAKEAAVTFEGALKACGQRPGLPVLTPLEAEVAGPTRVRPLRYRCWRRLTSETGAVYRQLEVSTSLGTPERIAASAPAKSASSGPRGAARYPRPSSSAGARPPKSGWTSSRSARTAKPPVCKIMDYGKFKYERRRSRARPRRSRSWSSSRKSSSGPRPTSTTTTSRSERAALPRGGQQGPRDHHVPRPRDRPQGNRPEDPRWRSSRI